MLSKIYIFFGIFSYLQIFIIPGLIFLERFKYKSNIFSTLIYIITISFIFNYLLIFALNTVSLNLRIIFYLIFLSELIYIFFNYKNFKNFLNEIKKETKQQIKNNFYAKRNILIYGSISLIIFGYYLPSILSIFKDPNDGYIQIYKHGDVIHYYSSWARDWYNNYNLSTSLFRPQLWSANIAVLYHFIGSEYIEIFSSHLPSCLPKNTGVLEDLYSKRI